MTKQVHFKLLLDEGLPLREKLPRTNARHTLKHIRNDWRKSGWKDIEIYKLCCKEKFLIVTLNKKDFIKIDKISKNTGIIAIHEMTADQIDKKLLSLLSSKTERDLYGKITTLADDQKSG